MGSEMTEAAPTPAALPPHVLERADVRSAIANHDFGEVFRLARLHGKVSYAKIAEAVGYKREHIGKMARPETDGKGVRPGSHSTARFSKWWTAYASPVTSLA